MTLIDWLVERKENCERIAETKTGEERAGWLADAAYFAKAIESANAIESARRAVATAIVTAGVKQEDLREATTRALLGEDLRPEELPVGGVPSEDALFAALLSVFGGEPDEVFLQIHSTYNMRNVAKRLRAKLAERDVNVTSPEQAK